MTNNKTSHSLNTYPFLSEEIERALSLRAWKDEFFREALIADPKGVIQRLFPQCFPNGRLPEELTIKVIEEDPDTCQIVLPSLPDEFSTLEIPEEEQLEFVANMGSVDRLQIRRTDSSDGLKSPSSEETKQSNWLRDSFKRKQAEGAAKKQETAREPLTREKIESLAEENPEFLNKLKNVLKETSSEKKQEMFIKTLKEYFPDDFTGSNVSERKINVTQDTADTRHIVLSGLPDALHDSTVPEGRKLHNMQAKSKSTNCANGCCTC